MKAILRPGSGILARKASRGYCIFNGVDYVIYVDRSISPLQIDSTVKHELVHVHQLSTGKLFCSPDYYEFNGTVFLPEDLNTPSKKYNSPWELEARELAPTVKYTRVGQHIVKLLSINGVTV